MGSPTKADIHFCPRVFSSRLFRKFCHDLSALVGPASLPHSLSKETVSSFPCCRVNALRSVKVLSEIGRVLQSGSSPPRNSPSPFVFKESQLLLFFRLLKGQSTLHLHRSSAGRMLRPTSSSQTKALGPESDMTYRRSQSKLSVKPGLQPRSLTLKPVLFFGGISLNPKQHNGDRSPL